MVRISVGCYIGILGTLWSLAQPVFAPHYTAVIYPVVVANLSTTLYLALRAAQVAANAVLADVAEVARFAADVLGRRVAVFETLRRVLAIATAYCCASCTFLAAGVVATVIWEKNLAPFGPMRSGAKTPYWRTSRRPLARRAPRTWNLGGRPLPLALKDIAAESDGRR